MGIQKQTIIAKRVNRIIGQLKGINNMLEQKRNCKDILLQINAIKAAVQNVGIEIARGELCSVAPEHKKILETVLKEVGRM
ncbi:hypothetical protein COU88_01150 [Candidatus Roizmanbacteria bacterium CG10_big_fil_rev_8_21_14_0_10_39_6]|uniref:Cytoplasmic protein n=1 Tax=Candidatus Roizmanbacteria bacterium CG10_big_fil_rev_8_21_14_0_10_39_6 TaxID=1974853 RepID=A0A2M8KT88_9BACT|nr:MAG: hypothetical protein COU88_01150 [Candidatus Roizmanbacteria bacterium CG10_big_fil_rev_8_21_14_0_10_39_6]